MDPIQLVDRLGIPSEVASTLVNSRTCEFATLSRSGAPITNPLWPSLGVDGTIDVHTALAIPSKAERARRNPNVCLSYCRPTNPELERPPIVVVSGSAAVRDADLQANTDRYVRFALEAMPGMFGRIPGPVLRQLGFYFTRIYIEVAPRWIWWWPEGDLTRLPERWVISGDPPMSRSDPPPRPATAAEKPARPAVAAPDDWRRDLAYALDRLGPPVLTTVDQDGYPVALPALSATRVALGVTLEMPPVAEARPRGLACLSFHAFGFRGGIIRQENVSFAGRIGGTIDGPVFEVDRQLAAISVGGMWSMARTFLGLWRPGRRRLAIEADRRGQPVPRVRMSTAE